jgi:hypothetical protein
MAFSTHIFIVDVFNLNKKLFNDRHLRICSSFIGNNTQLLTFKSSSSHARLPKPEAYHTRLSESTFHDSRRLARLAPTPRTVQRPAKQLIKRTDLLPTPTKSRSSGCPTPQSEKAKTG